MMLIGILSWYDERPSWLAGVVAGLAKAQIRHLIAVDGAYALYPEGSASSDGEQQAAIIETCRIMDVGLTLHIPAEVWFGNEVEKRNHAFALAETVAGSEDWYFLADADHFVTTAINHLHVLEETEHDAAVVRMVERYGDLAGGCSLRCVFRAVPGLRFDTNHYTYRAPDGRDLGKEPAADLSRVVVEHRTANRSVARKERQQTYYRRRDEMGVETDTKVKA